MISRMYLPPNIDRPVPFKIGAAGEAAQLQPGGVIVRSIPQLQARDLSPQSAARKEAEEVFFASSVQSVRAELTRAGWGHISSRVTPEALAEMQEACIRSQIEHSLHVSPPKVYVPPSPDLYKQLNASMGVPSPPHSSIGSLQSGSGSGFSGPGIYDSPPDIRSNLEKADVRVSINKNFRIALLICLLHASMHWQTAS